MVCLGENCNVKRPIFNLPGNSKGIYYKNHKNTKINSIVNKFLLSFLK